MNAVLWPRLAPQLFQDDGPEGFLGIGTIIGMKTVGVDRINIFSSGLGYHALDNPPQTPRRIWCVRGPLTAALLGESPEIALTDGALLSPEVWPKPLHQSGTVVVPHWETIIAGGWPEACRQAGMTLVDPTRPPDEVIPKIAAASLVLTESLHGAIIADTYDVPWIAFATSGHFCVFKWMDWATSLDVALQVHVVRPPRVVSPVRLSRPFLSEWGKTYKPTKEEALCEFRNKTVSRAWGAAVWTPQKRLLRNAIRQTPHFQRLLGFSSLYTAENLMKISTSRQTLSNSQIRKRLRDIMLQRLTELSAAEAKSDRPVADSAFS